MKDIYLRFSPELLEKFQNHAPNVYFAVKDYNKDEDPFEEFCDISRLVTKEQRYEVLKRQNWKCNICFVSLKYNSQSKWEGKVAHIDHVFPYSKRFEYPKGANKINEDDNLQGLCADCNKTKSNKKIQ